MMALTFVRLILFFIIGIIAVYIGFLGIDSDCAVYLVKQYGYWGLFFTFWGYIICLCRCLDNRHLKSIQLTELKSPKFIFFLLILLGSFLLLTVHEELAFKIVMDEVNLLGTSMSMHYDRVVMLPTRGYEINGSFHILSGELDKRPYFFPFLISVAHDFTGYRPENGFYLNQGLLLIFLCVLFVIGRRIGGYWAGILCVLSFSSIPLLAQVSNGCGFELLNVLMIVAVIYHSMLFLEKTNERNLATLLLAVILLAQIRYESVIFVFPVGLVIVLGWWKMRKIIISNVMLLSPIFLLPYPLLHRVFDDERMWQMKDKAGVEQPFGFEYMYDNFGHAVAFFFSWGIEQPNSFILAAIGVIGLVCYIVKYVPQLGSLIRYPNQHTGILICVGGLLGLFLLLMAYFWGQFSDPAVRRLSLPIYLLFTVPLVSCIALHKYKALTYKILSGVFILAIFADTIPTLSKNVITQIYMPGKFIQWQRDFMESHPSQRFLMIDTPGMWITHKIPAVSHETAMQKKAKLKVLLDNSEFDNIYVFQRFARNFADSSLVPLADTRLDDDFVLQPVAQKTFSSISCVRISEVIDIRVDEPIQFKQHDFSNLDGEPAKKLEQSVQQDWLNVLP